MDNVFGSIPCSIARVAKVFLSRCEILWVYSKYIYSPYFPKKHYKYPVFIKTAAMRICIPTAPRMGWFSSLPAAPKTKTARKALCGLPCRCFIEQSMAIPDAGKNRNRDLFQATPRRSPAPPGFPHGCIPFAAARCHG